MRQVPELKSWTSAPPSRGRKLFQTWASLCNVAVIVCACTARKQTGCRLDELLVQIAPFADTRFAELVPLKVFELPSQALQHLLLRGFGIRPCSD